MSNAIGPRDMTRIAKALEGIVRELRRMQEPNCRTHGEWVLNGTRYCECSICHHEGLENANFCPYCGADMRGEKE